MCRVNRVAKVRGEWAKFVLPNGTTLYKNVLSGVVQMRICYLAHCRRYGGHGIISASRLNKNTAHTNAERG